MAYIPLTPVSVKPKPASCQSCVGWRWSQFGAGQGFVPADGSGRNGVLVVLEAAGEDEEKEGLPTVGKAGYYLWSQLARCGLERDDFRIHNVLSCRPPENKLAGQPYASAAIDACRANLDATIEQHVLASRAAGLHPTILALGKISFCRIMELDGNDPLMKEDYQCYVHWSEKYGCWVVAADHPSYLMRGNHHLVPILQFAAQKAVEVARDGWKEHPAEFLLDPTPEVFERWVEGYFRWLEDHPGATYLAADIETPTKARKDEEKLAREEDEDYIILRISFAYREGEAVSIPWSAAYLPAIERLFCDPRNQYVWWNANYDVPRVKNQVEVRGTHIDAMLAWHVLNSALDKRLGFVTPFYAALRMWKHLSGSQPAYYNAVDSLAALINFLKIKQDLIREKQWEVFERHIIALHRVTDHMSRIGVKRDEVMRREAEERLTALLDEVERRMEDAIPKEARREKVYKTKPRDTEGVLERLVRVGVPVCSVCGAVKPGKPHFRVTKKKVNPCAEGQILTAEREVTQYYRLLEWKASKVQLQNYQASLKHQAVINRKENRVTFDEDAIAKLVKKYPKDPLYPLLLDHRKYQKLRGTYIGVTQPDGTIRGGLRVGRDGRIHPEFTDNPSTLRMACQNPNMQNLPRHSDDELVNIVRNLVVAEDGYILLERDYSAIEAVLVGYFARDPAYIRLAKLGIHAYLASHVLGRPADLAWSDKDLKAYFKEIKKSEDNRVQAVYNGAKRTVHLSAYGGTPRKMNQAEPSIFPTIKYAEWLQGVYWELCPLVKRWQLETQMEAHQNGYLRNPFGYIHRFTHVFRNVKENGKWVRKPGDQANDVLAFLPQSSAAGIIKEAMLRLFEREETREWLRLQVHDSLVLECPLTIVDEVDKVLREEMERPILQLPLQASFGMGSHLIVESEGKRGLRWGSVS